MEIVCGSGRSIAEVAGEFGIYDSTLGNWVKQDEFTHGDGESLVSELDRGIPWLQMDRDLWKRAVVLWVRESNK